MTYLLDTHVWVWMNVSPDHLSDTVRGLLADFPENDELMLSAISLWELCKLAEKGRITLFQDVESWVAEALDGGRLRVVPLDFRVFLKSTTLPQPFHNDPADQMIVATARLHNATLITRDRLLHDYPHVKTLW